MGNVDCEYGCEMEYDCKKSTLKQIVGENMRQIRMKKGLALEEVSEFLDITPGFLGLVERGRRGLAVSKLTQFTNMFETTIDNLCKERGL